MPKIIGKSETVVEIDGLKVVELAGNVATSNDKISIASVSVANPTSEPWLTLDYDEWICCTKGLVELHYQDVEGNAVVLEVNEGETAFIKEGERFRPVFPKGNTEYIPVCLPAFRPDRCHREEGDEHSSVTVKLRQLHGMETGEEKSENAEDIVYHMCQKTLWEQAVTSQTAYFPPTFKEDGCFTHATAVPLRLIGTANHFYTGTKGEWICIKLSRTALEKVGIVTKDEGSLPVGKTDVLDEWEKSEWICPHIYGGIPTLVSLGVLIQTYEMTRDEDGKFLCISGLTDN